MISRYRVSLDGVEMDEIDENLMILDVRYNMPKIDRQRVAAANLDGYEDAGENMSERAVTVTFELHIYDTAERNRVCQAVSKWAAAGGKLRINDREGQYLDVVCDTFPEIQSVRDWTKPLSMAFITTGNPYWISDEESVVTIEGTSSAGTLALDGNVKNAKVTVTATAKATVSSFKAVVGSTQITLTGISVPNGQKIVIDYLKDRYLRIRAAGNSAKMQPSSSDLLLAPSGEKTRVSFTSNGRMSVVFAARGLYR